MSMTKLQELMLSAPEIGQLWPGQGGVYVGLMRGNPHVPGSPDYPLIVPTDPRAYNPAVAWANLNGDTDATCSYDGARNTALLAQAAVDFPAARWAAGLEIDGHKDLYLPSRRELRLCWVNAPELFEEGWYWTSTQYSADYAYLQDFSNGTQYDYGVKAYKGRARAVRRLIP